VDILETGEGFDGGRQALGEGLGGVLDFASAGMQLENRSRIMDSLCSLEGSYTANLEASSNLRGKSPLTAKLLAPRLR
jgi:hypothetical protein